MVTPRRQAVNTVAFIDNYCQHYYSVFEDVRHFEAFKFLHLRILSEISRKSLPEIAKTVGLKDSQTLHHFLRDAQWDIKKLREIRLWLTYGFKQVKNELGWADFRLTDYESIERWWEIIFSAYLLVSVQATYFQLNQQSSTTSTSEFSSHTESNLLHYSQHPYWESGTTWKSALNNLRLIIQPYIFYCLIQPWLTVFNIPGLKRCFLKLINFMNNFRASPVSFPIAS